jgi:hypothetical protein
MAIKAKKKNPNETRGRKKKEAGEKRIRLNLYGKQKWEEAIVAKFQPLITKEETKLEKEQKQ